MAPIEIPSRIVHETFGRLRGLRALLRSMDVGFPEAAWGEEQTLQQQADDGTLAEADFQIETHLNQERFGFWVPRYSGYTAIVLVHSLVESQLFEIAAILADPVNGPKRGKRRRLDRARSQLRSLRNEDVSDDLAWTTLLDLESMRNFIVHSGGVPVEDKQNRWLAGLSARYPGQVWVSNDLYWYHRHIVVTLQCGAVLVEHADGFFRRVFPRFGFSVQGVRFVK